MRRADRERDFEFALEVLRNAPFVTLSFSGSAYAVPICAIYQDGYIYIHCAKEGEKLERIKADPHVCITAVSECIPRPGRFGCDYKSAVIFAEAEIITDDDEKMRVLTALTERHAPALPDRIEKYARGFLERTAVVRMKILSGTGKECIKK
jgi:nitroimidazol reductase NimA-like FMN-containing flavoprotein (pyridoxamine 5'-phosphate oxidase superfamily)